MFGLVRILVTGATGFIGSHFVLRALAAGHSVVGLVRSERPENAALCERLRGLGADLRRGDVLDEESLYSAAAGAECVCHFAAAFKETAPEEHFLRVNVQGTVNLANAAGRQGVRRVVLCGTAGIYGQRVPGLVDESSRVQPYNSYERTKLAAEQALRERAAALGLETVILRPVAVYGPGDDRLLKLFRSAQKGRFPVFGAAQGRRHMIFVSDLADAFLRACTEPAAAGQELIVGGPRAVPLREMLEILAVLSNRRSVGPRLPLKPMLALAAVVEDVCGWLRIPPPIYRRRMDFYLQDVAFDCSRAKAVLGWEPKVDLRGGLGATLEAARAAGGAGASS
jgi:nucleoside-diphosphate-sugar epimerase